MTLTFSGDTSVILKDNCILTTPTHLTLAEDFLNPLVTPLLQITYDFSFDDDKQHRFIRGPH